MKRRLGCRGLRARRRLGVTVVVLAVAGLVGACSGGDSDDGAGGSSERELSGEERTAFEREREFARCMRDQGIEGFPDPQVSGDGFVLVGAPMGEPDEAWNAAQEACQSVFDDADGEDETAAAGWEEVVPGGDCRCSDGSEFSFWVRQANPDKVVVYLQGGGACFSAETCEPDNELYNTTITEGPAQEGVFDFADERNPFADHSVVYVPYCTGDVHLGNVTTEYAPGLTVHHKGLVNGSAALEHLASTFPDATEVVVMGESAGSAAAPLYAGLVSDRFPDARITVLADGSGSYPDAPAFNRLLGEVWGTTAAVPPWPERVDENADLWSAPGLFVQSGRHDPEIVFARHDYAYDGNQESWFLRLGVPTGDLVGRMDANEAQIESASVNVASYTAPGEDHTVLSDEVFYSEEVDGQPLVDWVARLIAGEPVDDVHCTECAGG